MLRRLARRILLAVAAFYALIVLGLVWVRFLPPLTTTVHIQRRVESWFRPGDYDKRWDWTPIERISAHARRAVVAAGAVPGAPGHAARPVGGARGRAGSPAAPRASASSAVDGRPRAPATARAAHTPSTTQETAPTEIAIPAPASSDPAAIAAS